METDSFSQLLADNVRLHEALARARAEGVAVGEDGSRGVWAQLQGLRQTFRVGDCRLMMRYDEGSELLDPLPLAQLPHMPAWFCGVSNVHGLLLPVFDLALFLGQTASTGRRMLLVLGHGADAAGIYVEGLPGNARVHEALPAEEDAAARASAPEGLRPHIRASYGRQGKALQGQKQKQEQGQKKEQEPQWWWDVNIPSLLAALELALQEANQQI